MASQRDVGVADTLPPDDVVDSAPGSGAPAHWDRYELFELLGKGGMGMVYRARDRRLDRTIAIKFIRGADPNLVLRFLREARAQARIDHPHICRVYEVGEVEGRPYIALQLVPGEPLHVAAARMSLEDKLAVVRDIAAAVHEAHRLGIVHRDLKPANVLVERTEDGRWSPVVMDFGLAREATIDPGLTEAGAPLGTPAYMSPEQARGDLAAVDRRSDVYSLGATLYELLTGRLPFAATSLATALAQVIHDDPPAPRSVVPSLPIDLETITLKCLAKDPAQRYASARALADDLGRYLDGEPILGRRLSPWQRVRLRARRHRALVVLGAWSLAALVVVASLGIRTWLASRDERALSGRRTRLAEQLGRDAKDLEVSLRSASQLPLHDTRPDRVRVRARMQAIAVTPHDLGELGDAIVHNALGRGHLALHEWREAADELAAAAAAGLQAPELHAARGRALGELYQRALDEVREIPARQAELAGWLAKRREELARQYLPRILIELAQSRASDDDAELLAAMVSLYRADYAVAEQHAHAVAARVPGSFEARKLAADAAHGAAAVAFDHGDYAAARLALDRAAALYADAGEIARSDASVYEAAARTRLLQVELDVRQGQTKSAAADQAIDAIDRAIRADPDDVVAYTIKADVLLRWYRTLTTANAADKLPLLDRMAEAAAQAIDRDPRSARGWAALGMAHYYRGLYWLYYGDGAESLPWFARARVELDTAQELQPNEARINSNLGAAHRWTGEALDRMGLDPMPEYEAAAGSYERAIAINRGYVNGYTNQAELYTTIAEHEDAIGKDPRAAVDHAVRAGTQCAALDPSFDAPLHAMARAELALAHYLVETGGDPREALASARGYLDRGEALHAESYSTAFYRLVAATLEARFWLRRDLDPAASLALGRAALEAALQSNTSLSNVYIEAARLELVAAAWAAQHGGDPSAPLAAARGHAEAAIARNAQDALAEGIVAEVYLRIATVKPSRDLIDRGLASVEHALARNPRLAGAQAVRAALRQLRAR